MKKVILAFVEDPEGKLLLVKRSEKEKILGGEWYILGGHCNNGEDYITCLHREIKEELGVDISSVIKESPAILKEKGNEQYEIKVYKINVASYDFKLQEDEITDIVWVNCNEIRNYVVSESIQKYLELVL